MDTDTALEPEAPMTPSELAEAVTDALAQITDPADRFRASRDAEPLMKAALAQAARTAVNELWDAGKSRDEIAKTLGVTRQRVEQIVDPARLAKVRAERLGNRGGAVEGGDGEGTLG